MAGKSDRMSNASFKGMIVLFAIWDLFHPREPQKRAPNFGIRKGMTLVDYGCGPGRYTVEFAKLVGPSGHVYAVDVQELAIETVRQKAARLGLTNVSTAVAHGYDSGLPDGIADVVCAIDMFFSVSQPSTFLAELRRIAKPDGMLVIDDGHQPRETTLAKLRSSGVWAIVEETRDHLKCRPA